MPRNVEIKARVSDLQRLRALAESITNSPPQLIEHEDTFFNVPCGRLKLRAFPDGRGELIFYERPDAPGPKESDYVIFPAPDAAALKAVLSAALGVRAVVRKSRILCLVGQTRIHLDEVERLGSFLELEVVLKPGQSPDDGRLIAESLLDRLQIPRAALIDCAYVDLLEKERVSPPRGSRSPEGA